MPHDERVEVYEPFERQPRKVGAVGVAMERTVEVRARVGDHFDPADLELRPRRVVGARPLAAHELADHRRRDAAVGLESVLDGVGQVDQARHVASSSGGDETDVLCLDQIVGLVTATVCPPFQSRNGTADDCFTTPTTLRHLPDIRCATSPAFAVRQNRTSRAAVRHLPGIRRSPEPHIAGSSGWECAELTNGECRGGGVGRRGDEPDKMIQDRFVGFVTRGRVTARQHDPFVGSTTGGVVPGSDRSPSTAVSRIVGLQLRSARSAASSAASPESREPRAARSRRRGRSAAGRRPVCCNAYLTTPSLFPTFVNAAIARSRWARSWAAEICTRMRAWPIGTTG